MEGTARAVPIVPGPEAEDTIAELAERIGRTARAKAVFGDPIERDGVTVIPVARARWGFGDGGGAGERGEGAGGGGGGGGVMLRPVGFIEVRKGKARYRPIVSTAALAASVAAAGVLAGRIASRLLARSG
ncbi:MAG: spore germination protein GerW family protein [Gemmatimonadota bacterium]